VVSLCSLPGCHTYDVMTKSTRLSFSMLSFLSVPPESACAPTKNIRSGSILAWRSAEEIVLLRHEYIISFSHTPPQLLRLGRFVG
jgi:hypothetical protein